MRSLKQFAGFQEVFKAPDHLPQFFQENLVDPCRVVKAFIEDPQAHIRVFYYQYLKLCFEINSPKSEQLVGKVEELINNPNFKFYFYQEDDQSIFNDTQAKAFISQFFGELSSAQCTILDAINSYPIMDIIMVHFFRTLLILMEKSESLDNFIPRDQLLSFLCPFFGIDVEIHDNCIKYVDSDVFVYDLNERAVFMAFMSDSEVAQPVSQQVNSQQVIDQYVEEKPQNFAPQSTVSRTVQQPKPQVVEQKPHHSVQPKESYIASQWNDYTYENKGSSLADKGVVLKGSEHEIESKSKVEAPTIAQPTNIQSNAPLGLNSIKPMAYVETASISSGSDGKNIQETVNAFQNQNQGGYGQIDYLAKSNPVSVPQPVNYPPPPTPNVPSSAQILATSAYSKSYNSYQNSVQQSIPTKDKFEYSQSNQYNSTFQSQQSEPIQAQKPASSYSSSFTQDLMYKPQVENSYKTQAPVVPSANSPYSKIDNFDSKYTASQITQKTAVVSSQGQYSSPSQGSGKKRVFGLNVSDEFTNSLTIKKMAEPFKSNVTNIKSRARQYRNSLNTYLK